MAISMSCSSSDGGSGGTNGNSFTNSMDYEFTITINGEVHKVKGNTIDGIPKGMAVSSSLNYVNNECEVLNSYQNIVYLKINDVTAPNYISGQNLECRIVFPNLLSGINQAQVIFYGTYFDTLYTSMGQTNPLSGMLYFQTTNGIYDSSISNKLPFNITDLGTGTLYPQTYPLPLYNFGETLKGNYSGTVYLKRSLQSGAQLCDIPVQLSIDFKALRMY